jgi:hypothetical protein
MDNQEESVFIDERCYCRAAKNIKLKDYHRYLARKKLGKISTCGNKMDIVEVPDWTGITSLHIPKNVPSYSFLHGSDACIIGLSSRQMEK